MSIIPQQYLVLGTESTRKAAVAIQISVVLLKQEMCAQPNIYFFFKFKAFFVLWGT